MGLEQAIADWLQRYGPTQAQPPVEVIRTLVAVCEEELPTLDKAELVARAEELVVAIGHGWGPQVPLAAQGWGVPWLPAQERVIDQVHGWMKATAAWLHFGIQLRGYAFSAPFPTRAEAEIVARHLWRGTCDCWRLRHPEDDVPHTANAKKRADRCLREHRLSAWNPSKMSLWDFIARAVKGDKRRGSHTHQKGFGSGAVEQGMFFCDLYRFCDVRFGRVLVWLCPRHNDAFFEGPKCLACGEEGVDMPFHRSQTRREVIRRLLVKDPTGPYQERAYWHCQSCDNYYRADLDKCPLCCQRRTRGAARSRVWVLPSGDDGEDIVQPPQPPGRIPSDLKEILEKAIKNVLGVSNTSDDVSAVVWMALVCDIPERDATRTLGWKPRQIKDVMQKCKDLYLSGVAITAAVDEYGGLHRVGGEFEKLLAAACERSLPRIHTVVVAAVQRPDVEGIDPTLLTDDPRAAFRVLCADRLQTQCGSWW